VISSVFFGFQSRVVDVQLVTTLVRPNLIDKGDVGKRNQRGDNPAVSGNELARLRVLDRLYQLEEPLGCFCDSNAIWVVVARSDVEVGHL